MQKRSIEGQSSPKKGGKKDKYIPGPDEKRPPQQKAYEAVNTIFTEPIYRVMAKIKNEPFFVWPPKMNGEDRKSVV